MEDIRFSLIAVTAKDVADLLDQAERIGAAEDVPEGVRYIQLSDTLAKKLAARLRHMEVR